MIFQILTFSGLLVATILLLMAVKVLLNPRWILGWLRGSAGLAMAVGAASVAFAALDISSYRQVNKDLPIGTISFSQQHKQEYTVQLALSGQPEHSYIIYGDLWQIDAHILSWGAMPRSFGLKPGYRMARIGGRYYSIEEEKQSARSVHELSQSKYGFDLWYLINQYQVLGSLVEAKYGSATFLPMADGALFTIYLTTSGIIAKPENDPAQKAVSEWQ